MFRFFKKKEKDKSKENVQESPADEQESALCKSTCAKCNKSISDSNFRRLVIEDSVNNSYELKYHDTTDCFVPDEIRQKLSFTGHRIVSIDRGTNTTLDC